jgi:hypothetical protein
LVALVGLGSLRVPKVRDLYKEPESRVFNAVDRFGRKRYAARPPRPGTTASAVELAVIGPETIVEPTGAYRLGTEVADTLEKLAVGGDKDDAISSRRGFRHQSVVAVVGGVDDAHAVNVCLSGSGAGGAFEDYHCR